MKASRWNRSRIQLGLPEVRGRRGLVAALLIDSLGTGLFLPFAVIYPTAVAHIPLGVTGAMLSLATLVALPIPLLAGVVVDRLGARIPTIVASLLQAAGFAGYLVIARPWHLFACALCVAIGNQSYWAANGAFLASAAKPGERTRWFAFQGACRSAGLGAGSALAGFAVGALAGGRGFQLLAALNAVSFLVAATLNARVPALPDAHAAPAGRLPPSRQAQHTGYGSVLHDRPFLGFTATNVAFSLCVLSFALIVPVFVLGTLRQPSWVVGLLFTTNTALVATTQMVVTQWTARFRRTRALASAAGLFGLAFALFALLSGRAGTPAAAPAWLLVTLIASTGIYTLAELVMAPLKNALVADAAADELRGRYLAFYHLSWSLASTVAPALLTALFARGALTLWLALVTIATAAALALLRLDALLPPHAVRGAPRLAPSQRLDSPASASIERPTPTSS